jgi:hypothetical protein
MTLPTIYDPRIANAWPHAWSLYAHLVGWCYVGSVQHGTHGDVIDDVDLFAVVNPPCSLWPFEHWVWQHEELDVLVYSLPKYLRLLAKSNPNMLATLDPTVGLWLKQPRLRSELHNAVESRAALTAALGYAEGQYAKLEKGKYEGYMGVERKALHDRFGFDPKAAAHTIRILRFALDFADGYVVSRRPDAAELRAIKQGEWSKEQVQLEVARLRDALKVACEQSTWPAQPDSAALDRVYQRFFEGVFV